MFNEAATALLKDGFLIGMHNLALMSRSAIRGLCRIQIIDAGPDPSGHPGMTLCGARGLGPPPGNSSTDAFAGMTELRSGLCNSAAGGEE